jgi:hypothetical protein
MAFFPYPVWMVVLAALGVVAVVLGLVLLVRGFLRRDPKKRSPEEMAMGRLGALRNQLVQMGAYTFSIEASEILQRYVEAGKGLRATTQTSVEFLASIRASSDFSENERESLAFFLERADAIKYARAGASVESCQTLLERAEDFVMDVKPTSVDESNGAAAEPEGVS